MADAPLIDPQEIMDRATAAMVKLRNGGRTDDAAAEALQLIAALALGFDALIKAIRLKDEL